MTKETMNAMNQYMDATSSIEDIEESIYKLTENPVSVGLLLDELKKYAVEQYKAVESLQAAGINGEDDIIYKYREHFTED